jgi:hypothetical protein
LSFIQSASDKSSCRSTSVENGQTSESKPADAGLVARSQFKRIVIFVSTFRENMQPLQFSFRLTSRSGCSNRLSKWRLPT